MQVIFHVFKRQTWQNLIYKLTTCINLYITWYCLIFTDDVYFTRNFNHISKYPLCIIQLKWHRNNVKREFKWVSNGTNIPFFLFSNVINFFLRFFMIFSLPGMLNQSHHPHHHHKIGDHLIHWLLPEKLTQPWWFV